MSATPYPEPLERSDFINIFGGVYEHSPWVAEDVYLKTDQGINVASMAALMRSVVDAASYEDKLKILRSHPDLAGRLSLADLTQSSRSEQSGAGLDRCTHEELKQFQRLNRIYINKFGFPFIFAVKGFHRTEILDAFHIRVNNDCDEEFKTAIEQVHRIARLRLETIADEYQD